MEIGSPNFSGPPPRKYVVMLEDCASDTAVDEVQRALGCPLTNSKELGSELRAQNIYEQGEGIFFKFLDIAVVENIDPNRLDMAVRSTAPIVHYELERRFRPVTELEQLAQIKATLNRLQEQVLALEDALTTVPESEPSTSPVNRLTTWGLNAMGLKASRYNGLGIKTAVLDTGIFKNHPDFKDRAINGKSFIPGESWDRDGSGHGTHCTGILCGGKSDQNGRYYSVAPQVDLHVGQVLDSEGNGLTSGLIDGIDWALSQDCRVISLSLGAPVGVGIGPNPLFERVGRKALEKNCLIVAAAGNESRRRERDPVPVNSPADAESIMAVAALDRRLRVASFSNAGINSGTGGRVDIAAPGVEVYSAFSQLANGGSLYRSLNGTSMATPHVAGLAALYMEQFPRLSAEAIWLKMERNAQFLDGQNFLDVGHGLAKAIS